ncbi:hypothetical protein JS562_54865, partial [Agrobacterium sp. S2]|nr:hypothetical protein [Agrobacterium sp. S2]
NPVSQVMDRMLATLDTYNLESEAGSLEDFYRSVRIRAEGVDDAAAKQTIIKDLYERFFKLAFPPHRGEPGHRLHPDRSRRLHHPRRTTTH